MPSQSGDDLIASAAGINSLMGEVLEDHIREHMMQPGQPI
jgi:DNA-binding FrmR family transcriptional regulator